MTNIFRVLLGLSCLNYVMYDISLFDESQCQSFTNFWSQVVLLRSKTWFLVIGNEKYLISFNVLACLIIEVLLPLPVLILICLDLGLKFNWFQNVLLVSSNLPKNKDFFSRISALASKKTSNKKSSVRE